jgi:uncharacterized membrane protein
MLDAYNTIMPDGADRIMRMAEDQSRHRMDLEKITVTSQNKQGERGQTFALIAVLALVGAGIWTTVAGHGGVGGTIFGTTIVGVATVFALGKQSLKKSLAKKAQDA